MGLFSDVKEALSENKKEIDRSKPKVEVGPDIILDREWYDGDILVRVAKRGWSWSVVWPESPKAAGYIVGEAETYEEALRIAVEVAKMPVEEVPKRFANDNVTSWRLIS